jgi:integrase
VVPIDGWLADDLRAYLANDHPHGNAVGADYDPNAPLFRGRFGRTDPLPEGFSRDEIEPVRSMVLDADARTSERTGEPDRRYIRPDPHAPAIRVAPSSGYKWSVPVNPAGIAKHYFAPALAALGLGHVRWHDLRHAFAVMSLSAGEHYMSVSKMLGHASFVTTLTVYADYITEGDGGKAAPLRRPTAGGLGTNIVPMRRPGKHSNSSSASAVEVLGIASAASASHGSESLSIGLPGLVPF